nr:phosphate regulon sensor histidine kinase PhoR [uncultured Gellertiella sp.]
MESEPGFHLKEKVKRDGLLVLGLVAAAWLAIRNGLPPAAVLPVLFGLVALTLLRRADSGRSPAIVADPEDRPQSISPATLATLGALDFPVLLISREEEILAQNESARLLFGALPDGAHISARLRAPGLLDTMREGLKSGTPQQRDYIERVPSARAYRVRIAPLVGDQFLITFSDVSGLYRMDQMRTDFVANASHELRTPLASLRGFIETLQGPARADQKAQERFLGIMLEQVNRMSRLVDDLLSLSRLELKAHIAPGDRVDLVPLLSHVRDSLQPLAQTLGVEIIMDVPEGGVIVTGDRDELIQVFENLIENACKYGQEGKRVEVKIAHPQQGPLEVAITDHGPGIEAEHVPRLTERFYRVNVEASRSKKGTGLGLAIVKHILTRHRARLLIQSEPGAGSRFTVRF